MRTLKMMEAGNISGGVSFDTLENPLYGSETMVETVYIYHAVDLARLGMLRDDILFISPPSPGPIAVSPAAMLDLHVAQPTAGSLRHLPYPNAAIA